MSYKKADGRKKQRRIVTLEQWVEVNVREGKTVTTLYPSNEELLKEREELDPPPELVYRRINFREGVPKEYYWTTDDALQRQRAWHGVQRMTFERWVVTIEKERQIGDGHLGPCGEPMR
jgi:hypothetical protein